MRGCNYYYETDTIHFVVTTYHLMCCTKEVQRGGRYLKGKVGRKDFQSKGKAETKT